MSKPSVTREEKQRQIDIKNLRFYAEMFEQHEWSTVVIHWGVFKQTLNEIADRLDSSEQTLEQHKSELAEARKPNEQLLNSLVAIMGAIDAGLLVRDISRDSEPGWAMQQLPLVLMLAAAQKAIDAARVTDLRIDPSQGGRD